MTLYRRYVCHIMHADMVRNKPGGATKLLQPPCVIQITSPPVVLEWCWEVVNWLSVNRDSNFAKLKNNSLLLDSRTSYYFHLFLCVLTGGSDKINTCRCCK